MFTSLQDISDTTHIPMQEVRSAVVEAWMNALVIISTLSECVHVCVASVVVVQLCYDCRAPPKQI